MNSIFFGRYNMELHIVHKSFRGDIAVVGILYKLGRPDPFLAQVISSFYLYAFLLFNRVCFFCVFFKNISLGSICLTLIIFAFKGSLNVFKKESGVSVTNYHTFEKTTILSWI